MHDLFLGRLVHGELGDELLERLGVELGSHGLEQRFDLLMVFANRLDQVGAVGRHIRTLRVVANGIAVRVAPNAGEAKRHVHSKSARLGPARA